MIIIEHRRLAKEIESEDFWKLEQRNTRTRAQTQTSNLNEPKLCNNDTKKTTGRVTRNEEKREKKATTTITSHRIIIAIILLLLLL